MEYMKNIFPCFDFILEQDIFDHMKKITEMSNLSCVSLDHVYYGGDYSIELTRVVDQNGTDLGLRRRFGTPSLKKQLNLIKDSGVKEVCLVDDVIFSGSLVERVIQQLSYMGITVPLVCAGVGIQGGINRISSPQRLISCFRQYDDVIDEVCERDFYFGVPLSGRSFSCAEDIGLPYLLPYGKPDKWASIPVLLQKSFSEFCIQQTIKLFEAIEKSSNKIVCCSEIERKVLDQPINGRYVDFLRKLHI